MSSWIEIESEDDVFIDTHQQSDLEKEFELKKTEDELCIVYSRDNFGANYVSVPLKWVIKRINENT